MNPLQAPNLNLNYLNEKYRLLSPTERIVQFYKDFRQEDILVTSSFGTSSAILLHLVAQVNPSQDVHFIDTTYLFEETHAYKEALKEKLGVNIISILPDQWKSDFTTQDKTWEKDPNLCCSVNKVEPFDEVKKEYKVWVSGLMAYQTPFRKGLEIFEKDGNIIKFYPIVDVAPYFVRGYFTKYDLPQHPLLAKGYSSVGCKHCTEKGEDRSGRWMNTSKTECGLHIKKP
jgi:phosphoadenosine phosphosulfate reductase